MNAVLQAQRGVESGKADEVVFGCVLLADMGLKTVVSHPCRVTALAMLQQFTHRCHTFIPQTHTHTHTVAKGKQWYNSTHERCCYSHVMGSTAPGVTTSSVAVVVSTDASSTRGG